ncbi:hypothetical protein [Hyalangium versicolor]|uniref:hypothetical protein n=1 Tax=Hyalangium versicolor TaxID=2861190 RepID=UPI001CC96758|nr:hypothetical protein [Hyalangium versicolor]
MLTASELNIIPDAARLDARPALKIVSQRPLPSELPPRPQAPRTFRTRAEEIEDFESMWDVPVRSW